MGPGVDFTVEGMTKIAFLTAAEGIERSEFVDPWQKVTDAGYEATLLSPEAGEVRLFNHLEPADTRPVDLAVGEADVADYAALVLPGGVANPDALRLSDDAIGFVKRFAETGKPIAAICHAPWVLVEAGLVSGRKLASFPSIATDIRNAGGEWVDEPVVIDGNLITSRSPADLPAFTGALLEETADNASVEAMTR